MATKWMTAGALLAGMMLLGGCEPANETETVPGGTGTPPPPPTQTTPGTPPAGAGADRDRIVDQYTERLQTARSRIEDLRQNETQVPTERRAAFESAMANVQSAYSNAVLQVDRLREAEGTELNQMQAQVDPILEALSSAIDRAENIVEGQGQQPGQPGQPGQQPGQQPSPEPPPPPPPTSPNGG